MGDVKWIKITTDIFNDEKLLLIESLPDADAIIVIWFKLLCLAGKINNSGVLIINDKLAYTDNMLATIFRRKEATVKLALQTFEELGMIERVEGVITIPNWNKHQNLDQLEKKKNYQREYMREYREKQKKIACKTNSKTNVSCIDIDIDKELEKDIEKEDISKDISKKKSFLNHSQKQKESKSVAEVFNLYQTICSNLPKIRVQTDARKKAITKLLKTQSIEKVKEVFQLANDSLFLTGNCDSDWRADFDWLIEEKNFVKVLEGKYTNRKRKKKDKFCDNGLQTCLTREESVKEIDLNGKHETF